MKRSPKNNHPRICISIAEPTMGGALRSIRNAARSADLIELRLDFLPDADLGSLLGQGNLPFVVTNRRQAEGGSFGGDERARLEVLRRALDQGAAFVDVEMASARQWQKMAGRSTEGHWVLSHHDFGGTPSPAFLRGLFQRMAARRPAVVKIVTMANSVEDNLSILSLIPYARKRGERIVAFCMGEKGKMSRVFAPLLGAAWTYARLQGKKAIAPGQLTAAELKALWKKI